ncbi:MAG: type II toxin-antitoxin system VapB family antitoxin [Rudanella sp.]|nr:type II toxin-antitoxin system VapB family antitoxin [Rudanella sp.]
MRTNIDLDDHLIEQAFRLSHAKTKKEVVALALDNFVKTLQRRQLLELRGKVDWQDDTEITSQP